MNFRYLALTFLIFFSPAGVKSSLFGKAWEELSKQEKIQDIQYIIDHLKTSYVPYKYKLRTLKLKPKQLFKKFRQDALSAETHESYLLAIQRLLASFQDAHLQIKNHYFNHKGELPFKLDLIEGRLIVVALEPDWAAQNGIQLGDQVLYFNFIPMDNLLEEHKKHVTASKDQTRARQAAYHLTEIQPYSAFSIGETIIITFIVGPTEEPKFVKATWAQSYHLSLRFNSSNDEASVPNGFPLSESVLRSMENLQIIDRDLLVFFYNYRGKGLAFLRIESFEEEKFDGPKLEAVVRKMADDSDVDALIIDITANRGGRADNRTFFAGLFLSSPKTHTDSVISSKIYLAQLKECYKEHYGSKNLANTTSPEHLVEKSLFKYMQRMITTKINLAKIFGELNFHKNCYEEEQEAKGLWTKPLLILIDEFTTSAGDFFAYQMKDSGAAKLFGTPTHGSMLTVVTEDPFTFKTPHSEVELIIPYLMPVKHTRQKPFLIPDKIILENKPIEPDYYRPLSIRDCREGSIPYFHDFSAAASELCSEH